MAQMNATLGNGGKLGVVMPLKWWYPAVAKPTTTPEAPPTQTPTTPTTPALPTDEPAKPGTIATAAAGDSGGGKRDGSERTAIDGGGAAAMGRSFGRDMFGRGKDGGKSSGKSGSKSAGGMSGGAAASRGV